MILTLTSKRGLRPTNYNHAIQKMGMPLSITEQQLHDEFLKIENDTFWGLAIRNIFIEYTDTKFRELYCELLSQNDDNNLAMLRILGQPAYGLLLKMKP